MGMLMAPEGIIINDINWQILPFSQLSMEQLYEAIKLRVDVFIVEQNCVYPELDGLDPRADHMFAFRGQQLLAYQRCLPPGLSYTGSALGRIVVAPAGRGERLGRELVKRGITHNESRWPDSDIEMSAQAHLQQFYSDLGFATEGDAYDEDGIPHIHMIYRS